MASIKDLLGKTVNVLNKKAFGSDEVIVENNKVLKIDNSKSKIKKPPERIDVTANANKILSDINFQNKLGWNLTSRLLSIFNNKKSQENKSQSEKDVENQVIMDYVEFAKLINSDEDQDEGLGSIVFAIAIVRCNLLQRDQINNQGKEVDTLKKRINMLETQINIKNK